MHNFTGKHTWNTWRTCQKLSGNIIPEVFKRNYLKSTEELLWSFRRNFPKSSRRNVFDVIPPWSFRRNFPEIIDETSIKFSKFSGSTHRKNLSEEFPRHSRGKFSKVLCKIFLYCSLEHLWSLSQYQNIYIRVLMAISGWLLLVLANRKSPYWNPKWLHISILKIPWSTRIQKYSFWVTLWPCLVEFLIILASKMTSGIDTLLPQVDVEITRFGENRSWA